MNNWDMTSFPDFSKGFMNKKFVYIVWFIGSSYAWEYASYCSKSRSCRSEEADHELLTSSRSNKADKKKKQIFMNYYSTMPKM